MKIVLKSLITDRQEKLRCTLKLLSIVQSIYWFSFRLQIMNPFTLIGFVLLLICGAKYAIAAPVASVNSVATTEIASNIVSNDDRLLNSSSDIKSTESRTAIQAVPERATPKQQNKQQKPNNQRRKMIRMVVDCRPIERSTTKQAKHKPSSHINHPFDLFISHGWGPGRWGTSHKE